MDTAVQPPSYAVQVGESVRETEAERLRLRLPDQPPPASEAPACSATGAAHWRAAGTLPTSASAEAVPAALPAGPLRLWGALQTASPYPAANGGGAVTGSPSTDSFGEFAGAGEGLPVPDSGRAQQPSEATSDFGDFCAADAPVCSPLASAAPAFGAAERSPFEEALAFAVSAPVHDAPRQRPAGPFAWQHSISAAADTANALDSGEVPRGTQPWQAPAAVALGGDSCLQPAAEPEGWAWADAAAAQPAATCQSLPIGLDRYVGLRPASLVCRCWYTPAACTLAARWCCQKLACMRKAHQHP